MKKDHLSALDLSLGVHTSEIKWRSKSEAKVEQKWRKFCSPFPRDSSDSHAISSIHHVHEVP